MNFKGLLSVAAATLAGAASLPASAAAVVFTGLDNGVGPGGAFVNANAADAALAASAGAGSVITFEGLALGIPAGLVLAPGVSVTLTGNEAPNGGIRNTDDHAEVLGFNTTSGGSGWLQMWPGFSSAGGAVATFSFATGIEAFGMYMSDTQETFPGTITVTYDNGGVVVLNPTKNDNSGGVAYFGFHDAGASITSIAIGTGATAGTRDIWGIDDIRFVATSRVPVPATLLLAGVGLLALGACRRRG